MRVIAFGARAADAARRERHRENDKCRRRTSQRATLGESLSEATRAPASAKDFPANEPAYGFRCSAGEEAGEDLLCLGRGPRSSPLEATALPKFAVPSADSFKRLFCFGTAAALWRGQTQRRFNAVRPTVEGRRRTCQAQPSGRPAGHFARALARVPHQGFPCGKTPGKPAGATVPSARNARTGTIGSARRSIDGTKAFSLGQEPDFAPTEFPQSAPFERMPSPPFAARHLRASRPQFNRFDEATVGVSSRLPCPPCQNDVPRAAVCTAVPSPAE